MNPAKSALPAGDGHRALPLLAGSLAPSALPIPTICFAARKRHTWLRLSESYIQTSKRISILASSLLLTLRFVLSCSLPRTSSRNVQPQLY